MLRRLPLFIFLFIVENTFAQGENNQWCFGNLAGLDFNSGSPVATTSQVNTTEGSSKADQRPGRTNEGTFYGNADRNTCC